uniref:CDK5RAP1-like protein n=1 Tax=Romanomermis culicivorax TaxID=13658 RepID=A0A915HQU1_ROMCU
MANNEEELPFDLIVLQIGLRLIIVSGKTHDFAFLPSTSASDVAQYVFDHWPEDWQKDKVESANLLKLIYHGRFLHGTITLGALGCPVGKTTVMHLVARENLPEPDNNNDLKKKSRRGCQCCTYPIPFCWKSTLLIMKSTTKFKNLIKCVRWAATHSSPSTSSTKAKFSIKNDQRTLKDFINADVTLPFNVADVKIDPVPYVSEDVFRGDGKRVYFETYGCAMNVNDTEIARSVLRNAGYADVVLLMTCAIREGAEEKIWRRIEQLKLMKIIRSKRRQGMKIGILGCMAERLKEKILEKEPGVDLIAGPDSYRHLPNLLITTNGGQTAVNVALSLDETYADITPIRIDDNAVTALVSIMRGCDNMCTYCIVPFTRGRERSRPIDSILDEIKKLRDQGIKQVTLLGQNVNSYRDMSESMHFGLPDRATATSASERVSGFSTVYKPKQGGRRFADLLDKVSRVDPEMRIRFTSPHPKDFPDPVLQLIKERPNICKQIHLPAQSGNNEILDAMGRGYTKEAYLELVHKIRGIIPDIMLSSDFIAGFCGETEEAHKQTLELIDRVVFSVCYTYGYSLREKTRAHRRLIDNVPVDVKKRRILEMRDIFRRTAATLHRTYIGRNQLVLVESESKRSADTWMGRADNMVKTHFVKTPLSFLSRNGIVVEMPSMIPQPGDYVVVQIEDANSETFRARALYRTTITDYNDYLSMSQT